MLMSYLELEQHLNDFSLHLFSKKDKISQAFIKIQRGATDRYGP
jgi:hypothetical protein